MTPERWQQIRAIFEQAESLPAAGRAQFLDEACAGDAELREEVDSLLKAADSAGGDFLGTPAAGMMPEAAASQPAASRIGRRIGPYKIVAEIGHGGMGEVYRAQRIDGQFDQQVAIKLVRVGMGSPLIVQRFLHERQILASLNHPNIARLLGGGATDDEVPYLVMELIEGERIDTYCEAKKLSVSERLRLFLDVCEAVQYAHQRLVVHRDIKPSNILIASDGVPKLLDFGIAKMVDPAADSETTLVRPMTPEYASPEQIRGETITTASDVYSLGVVLFQLLTGRNPYGITVKTPHEWSRAITETLPQRASSVVASAARSDRSAAPSQSEFASISSTREPTTAKLRRRLTGDVDNILMMALRKEPDLRYGSVQQFADDITRHLNGLPVNSAKGSWSYFAKKFAARHKTGLAATALVMLALAAGIVTTERQARIARTERARAQKRFDDVRQFSDSLIFDVHDALQAIPGTTAARSLLLDRAVQYLDSVTKDAEGDSELQRELAQGYQRLATVQGDATVSNTGQVSAADLSIQKSMNLFEAVASANPTNTMDQLNVAMMHRKKGISDIFYPDGRPEIEKSLAITDRLMASDGGNSRVQMERAIELQGIALSHDIAGERTQAVEAFEKCLALLSSIEQHDPGYLNLGRRRAKTIIQYGAELTYVGEMQRAREQLNSGVALYESLVAKGADPDTVRDLAQGRERSAIIEQMSNELSAARKHIEQSNATIVPLARSDSGNVMLQEDRINGDFQIARQLVLEGNFSQAEPQLEHAIAAFQKLAAEEDAGPGYGMLFAWLGEARFSMKNYAGALESLQKSLKALESDVQYDDGRTGIATVHVRIGDALAALGRNSEAAEAYKTALAKSDAESARTQHSVAWLYPIADAYLGQGRLLIRMSAAPHNPEDRSRLRDRACAAYQSSTTTRSLIPTPLRMSPSQYPVADERLASDLRAACDSKPRADQR